MPRQNRHLVRDGRLQAGKKKRTDRSYLGGDAGSTTAEPAVEEESFRPVDEEVEGDAPAAPLPAELAAATAPAEQTARGTTSTRLPTSARALQRQGVRRRELDVDALAERDSRYALHELRRILILTSIVVITLIVLGIVLR
ncbi:MAG: hypothetical protein WEB52_14475 [Dehalococcoidia bacterium]